METESNRVTEPWERRQGEGARAFEAFAMYRDMGTERSLAKVGVNLGKSVKLMERWSATHRWVARAAAWEDEKDRRVREELTKGVTAMRKTHAAIAEQMLIKAMKALQGLPPDEMTPRDIATLVDVAAKLERLSRGEATERTEGKSEIGGKITVVSDPYDELTTEELRRLARLADESET
jgi:hypothetical protein